VWQCKHEEGEEASLYDKVRLGRPVTATGRSHQESVEEVISIEVGGDSMITQGNKKKFVSWCLGF
jgi:hypothetical protein